MTADWKPIYYNEQIIAYIYCSDARIQRYTVIEYS